MLAFAAHLGLQAGAALGGAERLPHSHVVLGGDASEQAAALAAHAAERFHTHASGADKHRPSADSAAALRVVSVPGSGSALAIGQAADAGLLTKPVKLAGPDLAGRLSPAPSLRLTEWSAAVAPPPPRRTG